MLPKLLLLIVNWLVGDNHTDVNNSIAENKDGKEKTKKSKKEKKEKKEKKAKKKKKKTKNEDRSREKECLINLVILNLGILCVSHTML